jgi:hypothetical protein
VLAEIVENFEVRNKIQVLDVRSHAGEMLTIGILLLRFLSDVLVLGL